MLRAEPGNRPDGRASGCIAERQHPAGRVLQLDQACAEPELPASPRRDEHLADGHLHRKPERIGCRGAARRDSLTALLGERLNGLLRRRRPRAKSPNNRSDVRSTRYTQELAFTSQTRKRLIYSRTAREVENDDKTKVPYVRNLTFDG